MYLLCLVLYTNVSYFLVSYSLQNLFFWLQVFNHQWVVYSHGISSASPCLLHSALHHYCLFSSMLKTEIFFLNTWFIFLTLSWWFVQVIPYLSGSSTVKCLTSLSEGNQPKRFEFLVWISWRVASIPSTVSRFLFDLDHLGSQWHRAHLWGMNKIKNLRALRKIVRSWYDNVLFLDTYS